MPKISVIMPVYNTKEEWLRNAIESILNQTYTDFEFIIINDGSTNNAREVILSYNDERIKYIEQENQGIAVTLNNGLDIAKGDYVARMDSDDISLPERFKKQVDFLDNNADISILGSWFEIFPEMQVIKHPATVKYIDLIRCCFIGHPTIMLRKCDLDKYNLRYNSSYKCEDYELWSRAIRNLKFYNLQEILLKYRWHGDNLSIATNLFLEHDRKVKQNMLEFLTDDKELQQKIWNLIFQPPVEQKLKYSFWERIFSIKNWSSNGKKQKIITIFGIKLKFRRYKKNLVVRLMGGLGNQMFQFAFGKALEAKTGRKVYFDKSWFEEAQKTIVNTKGENQDGVVMRKFDLDVFNLSADYATNEQLTDCKKKIYEQKFFTFDKSLLKKEKSALYEGYFQNEGYFKNITNIIKKDFTFPDISKDDEFNQKWIKRINECTNPVFIHLRRGDYLNLKGWALSFDYYKEAIQYIKEHIDSPTFFVFGQDCEEYIKQEFNNIDANFEVIGENNSKNKEDWKDIVLMQECKHAIIANSTFSWWAAWLGRANDGIVVAPSPFVNGEDGIICDNWIKIKR